LTTIESLISELEKKGNPKYLDGMSRFGIQTSKAFGVSVGELRKIARKVGEDHRLALDLWDTGIHEARILAGMIDEPSKVTENQMEKWALDFDSCDVVDGVCGNLFDKTALAVPKAHKWSTRPEEYVKRAGFVLMAELAVHDKEATDKTFLEFLLVIVREAQDQRNFVKKAVNWALRQIGKRNVKLNKAAIQTAKNIHSIPSKSAKWIAADALRELTNDEVQTRLKRSTSVRPVKK
jgi:3-methyladenine DNA glycosylase AlkD